MTKVNEDEDDEQLFVPSINNSNHYADSVEYEDERSLKTNESDDITLISLWSEDSNGHLFAGKPITAKNLIKRPINESSGDDTTKNVIE